MNNIDLKLTEYEQLTPEQQFFVRNAFSRLMGRTVLKQIVKDMGQQGLDAVKTRNKLSEKYINNDEPEFTSQIQNKMLEAALAEYDIETIRQLIVAYFVEQFRVSEHFLEVAEKHEAEAIAEYGTASFSSYQNELMAVASLFKVPLDELESLIQPELEKAVAEDRALSREMTKIRRPLK